MRLHRLLFSSLFLSYAVVLATAVQCGVEAGGALCPGGICCSRCGYCGTTDSYCLVENGCQLNCTDGTILVAQSLTSTPTMLSLAAAKLHPDFAATGDNDTRKREVAAFLGQTSNETTGGWGGAPGGRYAWGYCFNEEVGCPAGYCDNNPNYPCYAGVNYCGRGPMQLSNYNYGQFGESIGQKEEFLQHPEVLKTNVTLSFMSALWFWMTAQPPKPSCHSVITGGWTPSANDIAAGRLPGYGVTTNIINGGLECGNGGPDDRVVSRIMFYERYCDILGASYGPNLDCYNQRPFRILKCLKEKCQSNHTRDDIGSGGGGGETGGAVVENDPSCYAVNFYTYDGFLAATFRQPVMMRLGKGKLLLS
ncbi:hypothetical protein GOBAR_AA11906 [Gossypium barbadense]|uniref:Chitin-binding type-1 domain-containing protein n=1 Tax=Gossypium barbadense TaxID=3634 RepID=A0A2P5XZF8_GOSBA|nr:hypothetical protein GOBAR_AA11906 [Gossypium barbadense]